MLERRNMLYAACECYPLLRYRISYFHDVVFNSTKSALRLLNEHENRVSWHLQRLYRTRNIVIHGGNIYEAVDLLTENLHSYFDHIFRQVMRYVKEEPHYVSLDKVYFELDIQYNAYTTALKENVSSKIDTYSLAQLIVFGPS
jgi:hypothetical protein